MKQRNKQFKLMAVLLLLFISLLFLPGTAVASIQDQPDDEPELSIRFLISEDETLSYEYNPYVPLRAAVANFGKEKVTVEAELVDMGFIKDSGGSGEQVEFISENEVFVFPNTQIGVDPGHAVILEFRLKSDVQLQHGTYDGFLIVRIEEKKELIHTSLQVTVATEELIESEPADVDIEILDAGSLSYNYDDLVLGLDHFSIAIHNKGKDTAEIKWDILTDLVDEDGNLVELSFTDTVVENVESGEPMILDILLEQGANKSTAELQYGQYNGFVVLTDQNGDIVYAKFTLSVPSEDVVSKKTFGAAFAEWLQRLPKWISGQLFHRELEIGTFGLVILILLAGLTIRGMMLLHARNHTGKVSIEKIVDATGDTIKTEGLEALMRDWLEDTGVPPGKAKPSETVTPTVKTLITKIPGGKSDWLAAVFDFLKGMIFPIREYKVKSTLRKTVRQDKYELIFDIINTRTRLVEKIDAAKGKTPESAAEKAVSIIYHHVVMAHKPVSNRIPPWERFSMPNSINLYEQGRRLERNCKEEGDQALCHQALEKFRQATINEPYNVLPRLRVIAMQEGGDCECVQTLIGYLKLVWQWPELLEIRYRLAANLTFVDELVGAGGDNEKMMSADMTKLKKLLKKFIDEKDDNVFGRLIKDVDRKRYIENLENPQQLKDLFLELAIVQWNYLEAQLKWRIRFFEWLKTFTPFGTLPAERRYLRIWVPIWPWGVSRCSFSKIVRLARCCTRLRLEGKKEGLRNEVFNIVEPEKQPLWWFSRQAGVNWEVHYTAACYYALDISTPPGGDGKGDEEWTENFYNEQSAKIAVKHLDLAVRDPQFKVHSWLFEGDPDLKNLRLHPEFIQWRSVVKPEYEVADDVSQAELDDFCYAWEILAVGSAAEMETWKKHVEEVKLWTEVHTREVNTWCQRQHDLWHALIVWALEPGDKKLYSEFIKITGSKLPEKPTLGCKKDDYETHEKNWEIVAERAMVLRDCWDDREDIARADIHAGSNALKINVVSEWAEEASETWRALNDWATHPVKSWAKEEFDNKSTV